MVLVSTGRQLLMFWSNNQLCEYIQHGAIQVLHTDGKPSHIYDKCICRVLSFKAPVDLLQGMQRQTFRPQWGECFRISRFVKVPSTTTSLLVYQSWRKRCPRCHSLHLCHRISNSDKGLGWHDWLSCNQTWNAVATAQSLIWGANVEQMWRYCVNVVRLLGNNLFRACTLKHLVWHCHFLWGVMPSYARSYAFSENLSGLIFECCVLLLILESAE